ncbi:Hypothetical_protein [Hexamita inflata]|uniref:Hypothetical_protein n=1 Tax=Hexamita inflata TaxID=28002 RepID=A0AA86QM25_9EUKA|nr:Hypothetical protein HINF_LOCUS43987 [Hexamita inflata]
MRQPIAQTQSPNQYNQHAANPLTNSNFPFFKMYKLSLLSCAYNWLSLSKRQFSAYSLYLNVNFGMVATYSRFQSFNAYTFSSDWTKIVPRHNTGRTFRFRQMLHPF